MTEQYTWEPVTKAEVSRVIFNWRYREECEIEDALIDSSSISLADDEERTITLADGYAICRRVPAPDAPPAVPAEVREAIRILYDIAESIMRHDSEDDPDEGMAMATVRAWLDQEEQG